MSIKCIVSDSDFCVLLSLSFSPYAVSMWTMARHQVAAPWTQWPARAQASSCRPILSTANGESRSSTAPTVTTTSRPSLCPETPPLPVTCECTVSFASTWTSIKYTQTLSIERAKLFFLPFWICVMAGHLFDQVLKLPLALALVGSVHDQQLIVGSHIYS